MNLKIFHTADVHLGMKFAGYNDVQGELIDARFDALNRMVEIANKEKCRLFVIAGDLFHRVSVAKGDISRTAQILNEFQGDLVAVMPGNHDYISHGQQDLWFNFKSAAGDNVLVLDLNKVYSLKPYNIDANLYPAPCDAKHSGENRIGWINKISRDENIKLHIGIAHGSLEGFSPDFNKQYYPMTEKELKETGLDLWLLGHTHAPYPDEKDTIENIFFPGTPEPDGFDCRHKGAAFIINADNGENITVEKVETGKYQFIKEEYKTNELSGVERLKNKYALPDADKLLLKIRLSGRLKGEDLKALSAVKEHLERRLFYLNWNDSAVTEEISISKIEKEFVRGSFPYNLLTELSRGDNNEALQVAYELIRELRS